MRVLYVTATADSTGWNMSIFRAEKRSNGAAVFTLAQGGRRSALPWVRDAVVQDGVLCLSDTSLDSSDAAVTYVKDWEQAAWVLPDDEVDVTDTVG
jgi:hypothetical protein